MKRSERLMSKLKKRGIDAALIHREENMRYLTDGYTGVSSTDLNIQMRVTNRVSHLLKSASCCKHCESARYRNLAGQRKTCCNADHIGFCNTAVNVSFGIFLLEHIGLGGLG